MPRSRIDHAVSEGVGRCGYDGPAGPRLIPREDGSAGPSRLRDDPPPESLNDALQQRVRYARLINEPATVETARARDTGRSSPECAPTVTPPPLEVALLTLAEARAILADPMRDMAYLETRLGPLVQAYIGWKRLGRKAATTLDGYERILARFAVSLPPGVGIADVDVAELVLYLNTVPAGSWAQHRKILNGFMEWAIEFDHRSAKNPVKRLDKMAPGPQRTIAVFTEQELDAIVRAAQQHGRPRP